MARDGRGYEGAEDRTGEQAESTGQDFQVHVTGPRQFPQSWRDGDPTASEPFFFTVPSTMSRAQRASPGVSLGRMYEARCDATATLRCVLGGIQAMVGIPALLLS